MLDDYTVTDLSNISTNHNDFRETTNGDLDAVEDIDIRDMDVLGEVENIEDDIVEDIAIDEIEEAGDSEINDMFEDDEEEEFENLETIDTDISTLEEIEEDFILEIERVIKENEVIDVNDNEVREDSMPEITDNEVIMEDNLSVTEDKQTEEQTEDIESSEEKVNNNKIAKIEIVEDFLTDLTDNLFAT